MASLRIQILAAIAAALGASGKPPGLNVHRYRTRPIEADALPAIVVYPAPEESAERVTHYPHAVERKSRIRVEVRAVVPAGTPVEDALDPYYVWAVEAVLADDTFGGLALDTNEVAVSYDARDVDKVYGGCAVDFEVTYYTEDGFPGTGA